MDEGRKKEKEITPSPPEETGLNGKSAAVKTETAAVTEGVKPADNIDAEPSDIGHNALTRTFNIGFDEAWNGVVDTMMPLNLVAIDKSSGVLITGWIQDERLKNQKNLTSGLFGDIARFVRYKYVVRVSDMGGSTKLTVVPFAQVSKNRRWHQGKPSVVITEKLMRKLIKKMED
jgi:hypothetical protein